MDTTILEEYNEFINHLIAKILRIGILLVLVAAFANCVSIFIIDMKYMLTVVVITCAMFLAPTILFDWMQLHKLWAQFLVLGLAALSSGIMYTVLSYHVTIMFVIPVCIACLYNDKKYPIVTMLVTIPIMIVAHFAAFKLKVVPDEPLVTLQGVINYGILPRLIQYMGSSLVCVAAADRSHQLINQLLAAQKEQEKIHTILKQIIVESERLITVRNSDEMLIQAASGINRIIRLLENKENETGIYVAGELADRKHDLYLTHYIAEDGSEETGQYYAITPFKFLNKNVYLQQYTHHDEEVRLQDNILSMRFWDNGKMIAFLLVECNLEYRLEYMNLFRMMHTSIHKSLKNAQLNAEMMMTQRQLIQSLAEVCECKSDQTGHHIKRVGEYTKAMGRTMGLDEEKCETLSMAAMLHDVGKLKVPDEILEKKGKLTFEEFEEIKKHVHWGKALLENCPGEMMAIGKTIAYQHHEKWDGSGYLHMKEDEIDEYAALVAVIDVFDALVSKRSYKEAWDVEDAYQEIINCNGTHFSPKAVAIFKETYPQLLKILKAYPD